MRADYLWIIIFALLIAGAPGCVTEDGDDENQDQAIAIDDSPRWNQLHADGARTDSMNTPGLTGPPSLLFEITDTSPSPFSGPVVGPEHERSFGVGGKIYRVLGPGPISFSPPEGIEMVIGTKSAVQVIDPETGEILNERKFNLGAFTNFASVDSKGDVYFPDWGRLQKFSGGLTRQIWRTDFGGLLSGFGDVPAATITFLEDGNILLPILSGLLMVIDSDDGAILSTFDLRHLNPPILPDPQFAWAGLLFRNAVAIDGQQMLCLVNGEIIRLRYNPETLHLTTMERVSTMGFSSSTPTLDIEGKRLFIITYDHTSPEIPPMLRCFDYSTLRMVEKWSIETNVDFLESEDQLTVTYLPDSGIIINNSLYGHLSAYQETSSGAAEKLWTTADTIGPEVAAYIGTATYPDGALYFVENYSRTLYCLDPQTGRPLWTYPLPSQSIKKPIPNKGRLYVDHNYGFLALE